MENQVNAIYSKFIFGDTALYYVKTTVAEGGSVGLIALPKEREISENSLPHPLVQAAFTGDRTLLDYARGVTMKNRAATLLKIVAQTADEKGVVTKLTDGKGNYFIHTLSYFSQTGAFSVQTTYENHSLHTRTLEFLDSACLSVIPEETFSSLTLHRLSSAWSRECKLQSQSFTSLGLEESWSNYGLKNEKWGETGSMPNRNYYPFAAIEDKSGLVYAFTIEAPFSWQMEVTLEKQKMLSLSGGLADFETGHWRKKVAPGGRFQTHRAYFALKAQGGLNAACNALLHTADSLLQVPASEESMPIVYNEYCASWGSPSEEKIDAALEALKDLPVGAFVIDCGWFTRDDVHWTVSGGDWQENTALFPSGLCGVAQKISAAGMLPGIWFEHEVAASQSEICKKEELFLTRDGIVIDGKNRRFLDLRKGEVEAHLHQKVVEFLKNNGFKYLKIDYNDAYGVGCDGAESLGEGGRQVAECSVAFLDLLKREIPDLVIENCSSGGSRIEPLRMSKVAQCSFSDAHECKEIPFVAACVSRVVPARQMQVWAVLRPNDSYERIVYSLCAAMLGRICLSGDVTMLSEEQKNAVKEGLCFYQEAKEIVRHGDICLIDSTVSSYRNPQGRQIYCKKYANKTLIAVHFGDTQEQAEVAVDGEIIKAYTSQQYEAKDGILKICGKPFTAGAFIVERKDKTNGFEVGREHCKASGTRTPVKWVWKPRQTTTGSAR